MRPEQAWRYPAERCADTQRRADASQENDRRWSYEWTAERSPWGLGSHIDPMYSRTGGFSLLPQRGGRSSRVRLDPQRDLVSVQTTNPAQLISVEAPGTLRKRWHGQAGYGCMSGRWLLISSGSESASTSVVSHDFHVASPVIQGGPAPVQLSCRD